MRVRQDAAVRRLGLAVVTWVAAMALAGCGTVTQTVGDASEYTDGAEFPEFEITEEDSRTVAGDAAEIIDLSSVNGDIKIADGGDYVLSGGSDCRVIVDSDEDPVHLFLNGVRIEEKEGCAVLVMSASKIVITCMDGTENVIGDSAYYGESKDYDACIYSFADMTINGGGTLRVTGLYEDAIRSKDIVKVIGTELEVKAKGDGIRGNDGVCILDSKALVEAEKNGIRTSKNGHDVKGSVEISGSEASVIAGKYAIESYDMLMVSGSSLYLNGVLGKWQVAGDVFVEEGNVSGGR